MVVPFPFWYTDALPGRFYAAFLLVGVCWAWLVLYLALSDLRHSMNTIKTATVALHQHASQTGVVVVPPPMAEHVTVERGTSHNLYEEPALVELITKYRQPRGRGHRAP